MMMIPQSVRMIKSGSICLAHDIKAHGAENTLFVSFALGLALSSFSTACISLSLFEEQRTTVDSKVGVGRQVASPSPRQALPGKIRPNI